MQFEMYVEQRSSLLVNLQKTKNLIKQSEIAAK